MKRAALVMLVLIASTACDPGPLPGVHERRAADHFPSKSADPLPLDEAIQSGTLDDMRRLLEQGADPNARWEYGDRFPLQEAFEAGRYRYRVDDPVNAVRLLLQHGADPNARWCPFESRRNWDGSAGCTNDTALTPLIYAAVISSREIVEMLLHAGADPHPRDWNGASALNYASDEVIFEMISRAMFPDLSTRDARAWQWLNDYDGGPSIAGLDTSSPLIRAIRGLSGAAAPPPPMPAPPRRPSTRIVRTYLEYQERAERAIQGRLSILLRLGADPNLRSADGEFDWPPLAHALATDNFRAAALLLRNGADPNLRWCAQLVVVNYKYRVTREPACEESNGITALMFSAAADDRNSVDVLLQYKADRSLKDWAGRTALDYAATPEVRALLQRH
jgi:ankyrin repeat protein